jgi:uncharacterized protein (DUF1330 family)
MAAYIVVQVDVKDPVRYDEYRKMVKPTLDAFGGRFLVRGGEVENLEGGWKPARLVIIEFDSAAQARSWWDSEEYGPAKALRQDTTHTEMILVEGV